MTFEQRERAIGMRTAGMSARYVARHFQRHESTISRLLNRFQQNGNVAVRPRSGRPRKTSPREDRFLTTSSRRNRFLFCRKLGRLLGNAAGTRFRDRTVRKRLLAARLKAYRPYVGILLTLQHRKTRRQGLGFIRAGLAENGATFCLRTNPGITCPLLMAFKITGSLSH